MNNVIFKFRNGSFDQAVDITFHAPKLEGMKVSEKHLEPAYGRDPARTPSLRKKLRRSERTKLMLPISENHDTESMHAGHN